MSSFDAFGTAVSRRGKPGSVSYPLLVAANDDAPLERLVESQSGLPLRGPIDEFVVSPAFSGWQGQAKRVLDVSAAAFGLLLLGPLLILVALAVSLESRGPVIFSQMREGRDGLLFKALKFRTMRTDSCDDTGVRQTVTGDSRVTRVGKFLRRTSIDELPQLFNVLRGDMSLVGPRPHVSRMLAGGVSYRDLVPYYDLRLKVSPGLTGWAQANGFRGPTTDGRNARMRIDHDMAYIQNFSIWLDIKIIFLTIQRELFGGTGH